MVALLERDQVRGPVDDLPAAQAEAAAAELHLEPGARRDREHLTRLRVLEDVQR